MRRQCAGLPAGGPALPVLNAFERVARSGRLGTLVFLRCQLTGPAENCLHWLAETLAAATALLDEIPLRLQARGDPATGSLHGILLFQSGATVLVCTGPGDEGIDATLLGNHGAAYYPGTRAEDRRRFATSGTAPTPEAVDLFLTALRRSLAAGQPVELKRGTDG